MTSRVCLIICSGFFLHLFFPGFLYAFQEHGPREGLYVHLLGHVCFGAVMLWLYFMIRNSPLWEKRCWQSIGAGAALLSLWNLVTFTGHIMAHYKVNGCPNGMPEVQKLIFWLWYICKLDHLVCVAAMCFFFIGLRQLLSLLRAEDAGPAGKGKA